MSGAGNSYSSQKSATARRATGIWSASAGRRTSSPSPWLGWPSLILTEPHPFYALVAGRLPARRLEHGYPPAPRGQTRGRRDWVVVLAAGGLRTHASGVRSQ